MKKSIKIITLIFGILFPLILIIVQAALDVSSIWNSWGEHDGVFTSPDIGNYLLMVFFKLSIYILPSTIIAIGSTVENKKNILKKKYLYYFLNTLTYWSVSLLIIKIASDNIFELDRIWNFKLFNSVKEITTLAGFIVSLLLKQNIKFDSVNEISIN